MEKKSLAYKQKESQEISPIFMKKREMPLDNVLNIFYT
jgi:hypothetical protein